MTERMVSLSKIDGLKAFVTACCNQPFSIELTSGRYTVDAKSIMGVFSLDTSKPVKMVVHADDERVDKFLDSIKDCIVEN